MQGIHPEAAAANFPLLTAKMAPKEVAALKKSFARPGFVKEIEALEGEAKAFAAEFSAKTAAAPSQAWKLLHSAKPEAVLWVAHTSKNGAVQAKFKGFFTEWAQAKQRLPYVMMQEMRIVPELAGYDELLDKLFFELMDAKLGTAEEMKAYLEPYSPPAPPPPVHLRRPRVAKKDAKPPKSRKKAAVELGADGEVAVEGAVAGETAAPVAVAAKAGKNAASVKSAAAKAVPVAAKAVGKKAAAPAKSANKAPAKKVVAKKAAVKKPVVKVAAKKAAVKPAKKVAAKAVAKKAAVKPVAKKAPVKHVVKKVAAKAAHGKKAAPAKKAPAKKVVKAAAKKRR
jgi:tRNA nucleotidyltransferase (CCA-adding enzyme)